jgi:hypothetical protein
MSRCLRWPDCVLNTVKSPMLTSIQAGPNGRIPSWSLEEMLQQRMPKTYLSHMDTIESMLETIQSLEEALGTDKTHFQSHVSITGAYVS